MWNAFLLTNIKIHNLGSYIYTPSTIVSELNKKIRKLPSFVIFNPDAAPEGVDWDLPNFTQITYSYNLTN